MKFLSVLGKILVTGSKIVTGLGPMLPIPQSTAIRLQDTLAKIAEIVVSVEAFGTILNTPGPEKLRAASPLVGQIILQSDLLTGKKIDDPVLFQKGIASITSGMADVLNSIKDDIKTESIN